jgi:hypothetical protein
MGMKVTYHSVDFKKYRKGNRIITMPMPPHLSHLLQPLDFGCFGLLKKAYGLEIEQLIRLFTTHVSKTEFFPAFYAAHQVVMTKGNIQGRLRGAGLVPFDPRSIDLEHDMQVQTPMPAEDEASMAESWTSRTPKTALEAVSQSEYLERRIRRRQSNSPGLLLEALGSLVEGTKAIMAWE